MVSARDAIQIIITADAKKAEAEFRKVGASAQKNLGAAEKSSVRMRQGFTKAGIAMGGAAIVIGGAVLHAAKAAAEADLEHRKLAATIAHQPALLGASVAAFEKQQKALQDTTKYGELATTSVQNLLGSFHLNQAEILKTTPLVEDLASKFGLDLPDAATKVGKALLGNGKGLRSYGINLKLTKDETKNFALVTDALGKSVGGFSKVEGQTLEGQLARIGNKFKEVEKEIGTAALPAIQSMLKPVSSLASGFSDLPAPIKEGLGAAAGYAVPLLAVGSATSFLVGQSAKLGPALLSLKGGFMSSSAAAASLTVAEADAAAASQAVVVAQAEMAASVGAYVDANIAGVASAATLAEMEATSAAAALALTAAEGEAAVATVALATATEAASLAMTATPWGAIAVGVAVVATAILTLVGSEDSAIPKTERLTASLTDLGLIAGKTGKSVEDLTRDKIRDLVIENPKLAKGLELSGVSMIQFIDAVIKGGPALGKLRDKINTNMIYTKHSTQATRTHNAAVKEAAKQTIALNHGYEDAKGSLSRYTEGTKLAARASKDAAKSALHETLRKQAHEARLAGDAIFHAADAASALHHAERAGKASELDYADSLQNIKDKTIAYSTAIKEHGRNSDEARQAQRDLTRSVLDSKGTFDDALDNMRNQASALAGGATSGPKYRAELGKLAATLTPGSELSNAMQGTIGQLDDIERTRQAKVLAGDALPGSPLYKYLSTLGLAIDDATRTRTVFIDVTYTGGGTTGAPRVGRRASGGPVNAGEPYMIGENGPEIMVPGSSGMVVPNHKINTKHGGGIGGGNNYTVNVSTLDAKSGATAVIEAIAYYERTRGKGWRAA